MHTLISRTTYSPKEQDLPAGRKINLCSGCKWARYCSKDCQKLDWKDHKSRCLYHRREMDSIESRYLALPNEGLSYQHSEDFMQAATLDLFLAFSSALRVGEGGELVKTHSPIVHFSHTDPQNPNPRLRFTLTQADIVPRTEACKFCTANYHMNPVWLDEKLDATTCELFPKPARDDLDVVALCIYTHDMSKSIPIDKQFIFMRPCPFRFSRGLAPPNERAEINDNWEETLRYTLSKGEVTAGFLKVVHEAAAGGMKEHIKALEARGVKDRDAQYKELGIIAAQEIREKSAADRQKRLDEAAAVRTKDRASRKKKK